VRFEGFTATDWTRVLSLFAPRKPGGKERDPDRPRGAIFAVHGEGRLRKLVHTRAGRLRLDDVVGDWPLSPEELAQRHHASFAAVIEMGSLEAIMERFGAKVKRSDDLTAQSLLLVSLLRDEIVAGRIKHWPARLAGAPIPSANVVNGTLDAVCPAGHTVLVGLFEAGELWTSIALRRHASGGFDRIVGPDDIRRDMGLLAGDFRRDYRHLVRTVERRVGKLSLGCFAEAPTFRRLEVDPNPGAWAKAVAVREVILSPVPPALAIPLGIDAGRAAFSAVRTVLDRVDAWRYISPFADRVRDFVPEELTDEKKRAEIFSVLGFEPFELLRRLLSRDR